MSTGRIYYQFSSEYYSTLRDRLLVDLEPVSSMTKKQKQDAADAVAKAFCPFEGYEKTANEKAAQLIAANRAKFGTTDDNYTRVRGIFCGALKQKT